MASAFLCFVLASFVGFWGQNVLDDLVVRDSLLMIFPKSKSQPISASPDPTICCIPVDLTICCVAVALLYRNQSEAPAVVKSYYNKRIVGCPGGEGEGHVGVYWRGGALLKTIQEPAREAEQNRKYEELQLQLQTMMKMFQQSQKPPS
ncbi:hypothetical protein J1N35_014015 [Gossypium stocksii]|uniref:Uncharacterized protein n=1 Tax=Gossypium stocksii TaxID=47602 RepID=A0A9D3VW67_9ROSI|nr:hypothetical protein J1N35_014015 [Gossypium stocksii]